MPVAAETRWRSSPSSIASTQFFTDVACAAGPSSGKSGPRCLGGVRIRFNRGAGDDRAQEVHGGDLAHQLLRRGRDHLVREAAVGLEMGQSCHRVDAEGPADADNGRLGHLAPDKLLGQGGALDPRQPADIGRAGVRRNTVQPALEGFGGEGHMALSTERMIGLILAADRGPLRAVPGIPACPDLCHPDQRQARRRSTGWPCS